MLIAILFVLSAGPVTAQAIEQELELTCSGEAFGWRLNLGRSDATLNLGVKGTMDIMDETRAQGGDWPRALTLIGDRDTAILILENRTCAADVDAPYTAEVLTQRGQTPILLTGCCRIAE